MPGSTPAKRTRKPPEQRREEIIAAARDTAVRAGLDSITARDVARAAGIAPGLIHHYFDSLEELLAEAFGAWADEVSGNLFLPPEISALDRIGALGANLSPEHRFWHDALAAAPRHKALRERARAVTIDYVKWVEGVIHDGVEDGSFSCDDPAASAWRIVLLLDGLLAMVFVLRLLEETTARSLLGGAIDRELGLVPGTFASISRRRP